MALEIVAGGGGDGLPGPHLAQQVEEDVGGVHHQLLLEGGQDAALQGALFGGGVIEIVGSDDGTVPAQCSAQQIVR